MRMRIRKPAGMREALEAVGRNCEEAAVLGHCGMRPPHYIITLDAGSGQSVLTEYMARAYADAGVRHFGGLDLFLEYRLDGTMEQLHRIFADIRSCAVYMNDYEGVVAMDISGLEPHVNEGQTAYFLQEVAKAGRHATFLFFVPQVMSRNMHSLTAKLMDALEEIEFLELTPYTAEDIAKITLRMVGDAGVDLVNEKGIHRLLADAVAESGDLSVRNARKLCRELLRTSDFSGFTPVLTVEGARRACKVQAKRA